MKYIQLCEILCVIFYLCGSIGFLFVTKNNIRPKRLYQSIFFPFPGESRCAGLPQARFREKPVVAAYTCFPFLKNFTSEKISKAEKIK